ncbi:kinetochore protein Mal2 [Schizosaccharomyces cryophilus OY26]|uniref:Kinetochore protein Mal2 n=1 Tax=Schizosaccharomyces cryophilus (strain OY26 / ATCC MYA-4695 / CBS 11777 / NBRC 106824 / NRRL Y48691) TaxID=653667 RepID=S9X2V4_SCHCR|nr:kinetochore protein Mal2 [Schizosaccharomyces cryophilus OY26]EPY51412.1 kinetochore protein Mal2 [Schizosaccharomyces cryophilus OY26]
MSSEGHDDQDTLMEEISSLELKRQNLLATLKELEEKRLKQKHDLPDPIKLFTQPPFQVPSLNFERLSGVSFFIPHDPEEQSRKRMLVKNPKTLQICPAPLIPLLGARFDFMMHPMQTMFPSENPDASFQYASLNGNAFEAPHYIIFRVFEDALSIYKYTLPNFFRLDIWADEYLASNQPDRLRLFLWRVHKLLTAHACRKNLLSQLNNTFQENSSIQISADLSYTHLEIDIKEKWKARFFCFMDSTRIQRCQIYEYNHTWHRDYIMEASLISEDGWLDILQRKIIKII